MKEEKEKDSFQPNQRNKLNLAAKLDKKFKNKDHPSPKEDYGWRRDSPRNQKKNKEGGGRKEEGKREDGRREGGGTMLYGEEGNAENPNILNSLFNSNKMLFGMNNNQIFGSSHGGKNAFGLWSQQPSHQNYTNNNINTSQNSNLALNKTSSKESAKNSEVKNNFCI